MGSQSKTAGSNRIKELPAQELLDTAFAYEADTTPQLFKGMSYADIAHVLMLIEEKIIPSDPAKNLLTALLKLHEKDWHELGFDPQYGDTYTNREKYLKKSIGNDSGWMHVGRARRECSTIGFILSTRDKLHQYGKSLVSLSEAIISSAQKHAATVMPDYTYLQHAQPTTFGHYLLTFEYPLLRDMERLMEAYSRFNKCPAGSGSVNGSRLPLNRLRLAELLGFINLSIHTRDSMWRPDMAHELFSILVAACLNINRLVEELQIWSTSEFGLVEISGGYCRTSIIMPQKKNPYGLSYFRGLTGLIVGRSAGMSAIQKAVSGQPDNRIFAYRELPDTVELCSKGLNLIASIIATMQVNRERMSNLSKEGYSGATDLAEIIMIKNGIDYTTAHTIVGASVRYSVENNLEDIDFNVLIDFGRKEGVELNINKDEMHEILEPLKIVSSRKGIGGASYDRIMEMITECREKTSVFSKWLQEVSSSSVSSLDNLISAANNAVSR